MFWYTRFNQLLILVTTLYNSHATEANMWTFQKDKSVHHNKDKRGCCNWHYYIMPFDNHVDKMSQKCSVIERLKKILNLYLTQPRLWRYSTYSGFIWNFFSLSSKVGRSLRSAAIIQYLSESRLWLSVKKSWTDERLQWKRSQQQSKMLCNIIIRFQYPEGVNQWSGSQSKVSIVEVLFCKR